MQIPITVRQRQFLESQAWGSIFRGGVGSGKTHIMCIKAALNALNGRRQLIVSFSYPMLRDVVRVTMGEVLSKLQLKEGEDYSLNKSEMTWLVRGTEILMRSGDKPDSLRGLNVHDVLIDEAREFPSRSIFDILIGRMRNAEDSSWSACTTPNGKDWLYRIGEEHKSEVEVFTQSTLENPFIPKSYMRHLLKTYTGLFSAQEIRGEVIEFVGEVIDPSQFKLIDQYPVTDGVRYWDLAFATKKRSDWSVGALCTTTKAGEFIIADIVRLRAQYPDLKETIVRTALSDGPQVKIGLEDVGAQRAVIDDVARDRRLANYVITARRPTGTKLARAMPWVSRTKLGNVKVVMGPWLDEFRSECASFRADMTHPHDDQVDAVSGAWHVLNNNLTARGMRLRI
ncbi:MAG: phage terminase large subunit [Candidatus Altiarchaeales archaeon]|nr:phage terminase large subunit [Candidatus Altiarchaeales archaeon]